MVRIKNEILKQVRNLVENALEEAQEGYNEADNIRKSAHISNDYKYADEPGISEADAQEASMAWNKTTKKLTERLQQAALFVEKNFNIFLKIL